MIPFRSTLTPITLGLLTLMTGCEDPVSSPPPPRDSAPPATPGQREEARPPAASASGATIYPTGSVPIAEGAVAVYGEPNDVNFGIVKPGSKLEVEVKLVNPTDSPITIAAAVPTCQCTTVEVAGETIPPRGAVGIPMTLQVPSTTGEKQAAVNVLLSGPNGQLRGPRLTLTAIAAYPVRTTPLFIDALAADRLTGNVALTSTDGRPFKVRSVNGAAPDLITPNEPLTNHVIRYDLTADTAEAQRTGAVDAFPKWMLFETDHPDASVIELRIRHPFSRLPHQTRPVALQFDGYIANVGTLAPGGNATFNIELKQFAGKRVNAAISENANFRTDLLEQVEGDGDRVRVKIAVTPLTGQTGVFMVPVRMDTTAGSEVMYVVGTIR
ncbi:MAG: DUF1573 domain-containing protein [Phycisphaerales bacterium]|nr:DUF1573 domain-containing protein [Phycisphaerales bacterium]